MASATWARQATSTLVEGRSILVTVGLESIVVDISFVPNCLWISYTQDAFASERRKAKMLNFSIAYGKTAIGLSRDWKVVSILMLALINFDV